MRLATRLLFLVAWLFGSVSRQFNYLAASTMRLADIKEGIQKSWEEFNSQASDIGAGLMPWEESLIGPFVNPGTRVLIVGAGSGRDVIALVQRGCSVTGIEPAGAALRLARQALHERGLTALLIEGFFEDATIPACFDVALFSYHSYSYIPESRRRIDALRRAAAQLSPGGVILISYAALARPRRSMIWLSRLAGAIARSDWRLEPGDIVNVQRGRFHNYVHAFGPGEIEQEAAAAGLQVEIHRESPEYPVAVLVAPETNCDNAIKAGSRPAPWPTGRTPTP
jgi:SAM-dependent methyltransferase